MFGRLLSLVLPSLILLPSKNEARGSPNFGSRPNLIFLLVDDWGAGDVDMCPPNVSERACPFRASGGRSEVLFTPRIKEMASEGMIMSNYYAPRGVCTPSRAALLAGRDPVHFGMTDSVVQLLSSPSLRGGFPQEETTVAEYLKDLGYHTAFSGKWHLGFTNGTDPVAHTPIRQGYDETFYFVEGSNGEVCEDGALNPPNDNNLYHCCAFDHVQHCNSTTMTCEVMEQPIRWENVTSRHLAAGLEFLERAAASDQPFFYSHHFLHAHVPWVPSRNFVSHPTLKHWTDMVGEVDWAVGVILDKLKKLELDQNTMVILTSDNGPYLESASSFCPQNCKIATPDSEVPKGFMCTACDSNTVSLPGPQTGGKGMTWEGGQHVPGVFWWPGKIPAGTVNPVVASSLDYLPTVVALAGGSTREDTYIDGRDLSFALFQTPDPEAIPEGTFVYWCGTYPMAVRVNQYKVIWRAQKFVGKTKDSPTSKTFCAGTGNCCVDTPTRLCNCQWATDYSREPIVIDLINNPYEDPAKALDQNLESTIAILQECTTVRSNRIVNVMSSRGLQSDGLTPEQMLAKISLTPNIMQVDFCGPAEEKITITIPEDLKGLNTCLTNVSSWESGGCDIIPKQCQIPDFAPYENCSITSYQGAKCAQRLPCGKQEGYMGPFEYVRPEGENWDDGQWELCGAYKYGPNSYFPDDPDLQASVCAWQDNVNEYLTSMGAMNISWCRLPACASSNPNNAVECEIIFKYGLNNVPTGYIYNSPYPDDQTDPSLMYPNQKDPPEDTKNVNYPKKSKSGRNLAKNFVPFRGQS